MANIRACKGCIYFVKHYGNKDSVGKRTVSNYWCVKKQGFIKRFPVKCERREDAEGHCSSEKGAKMQKTKDEVTDE